MSEKANQYRIGVFVLVGVALLLGGLFVFGIRSAFEPTHMIETYVTGEVEGLSEGSIVTLRGVAVGKVSAIGFSWNLYGNTAPRCVVIRMAIKQSFSPLAVGSADAQAILQDNISKGLRAVVQGQGITGTSIVALKYLDAKKYPPLTVSWTPKYAYIPSAPSEFGQILAAVSKTLSHLEKLDVEKLVNSLDATLQSADLALKKLSDLDVAGISNNVNRVATDASEAVLEVKGLVQDARTTLKGMKLDAVGEDTSRLVNNLDARLATLLDKLSAIDVRALNETLAGTREAARSLNEALQELKRYPSGFLLGGAPEPVPGLEKEKK
jgi:phospholipid/cholesterol/gamma-HCH transport system substrate-binding protein